LTIRTCTFLVACVALVHGALLPLAAQEPAAFTLAGEDAEPSAWSPAAVRSWQVETHLDLLGTAPARLGLPLASGEVRDAELTDFERRGPDDYTWRGRLVEGEGSVTLTVRGKALAGFIEADRAVYELVPRGEGTSGLVLLNTDGFPECGTPVEAEAAALDFSQSPHPDPQGRIDVMVLYTASARSSAGGTANVQATVQAAVDAANTAYGNSQITTRLRLVHTEEVPYVESGGYSAHLNWLASDATVAKTRETYRADMVDLLVTDPAFCGQAYLMSSVDPSFASSAFSVVTLSCAVGNLSFAHELGHNMAAHHDPANGGSAAFPFAYGHFVNGSFRTVMSYSTECTSGCTRVSRFSNPNVIYLGQPTGIAGARDNHRTLNATDATVADFRQEITASDFFTLTPCRVADTRATSPLSSGAVRTVPATNLCGVPADAAAVALNVTVVGATGDGYLRLYTDGTLRPDAVVSTFSAGAIRANNAILPLPGGGAGALAAEPFVAGGGTVHMVVDVFGYFALPPDDLWTQQEPMPLGRTYVASAVAGGKLYVIGGQVDSGQIVGTVEAFDPVTGAWQTGCPMPTPRAFASAAEAGGKIYVFGGQATPGNPAELNVVERFDPAAASCATAWTTRNAMPVARSQAAAAVVNGTVYLAGGAGTPQALYAYDPVLDSWSLKASIPSSKIEAAAAASGGRVYMIGGGSGGSLGSVLAYDPVGDAWSTRAPLPVGTSGLAAATIGGKIYAVGGNTAATQEYDPVADTWLVRASLPASRSRAAAGVLNGHLHVVGGSGATGFQDVHEMYVPPAP